MILADATKTVGSKYVTNNIGVTLKKMFSYRGRSTAKLNNTSDPRSCAKICFHFFYK